MTGEDRMDKQVMREQFEAHFSEREHSQGRHPRLRRNANGEYEYIETSTAWWAWQASREAVEVEAPKKYDLGGMASDYRNQGIDECISAIKYCGLKVKQWSESVR